MDNEVIDLGVMHERMVERTKAYFGKDVEEVSAYKRYRERMPRSLIIYSLEAVPLVVPCETGTGQLMTGLDFAAFVVVNGMDDDAALRVRWLAVRLKGFLFRNNFDMGIPYPVVGDAEEASFAWPKVLENAYKYEIWRVDFSYPEVILGKNCWEER